MTYLSFYVHVELTPIKEEEILRQLVQKAEVDHAEIEHDLSIIMIVGEKNEAPYRGNCYSHSCLI